MPGDEASALPTGDALFDSAAAGLLLTSADGTIRRANAAFCRWTGREATALVDKQRVQALFTMGGRVFYQTHALPLLQIQGSVSEVKLDLVHHDGHPVPVLINAIRHGRDGHIWHEWAFMVVTDRHKYEAELLRARKHAEEALASRQKVQKALQESSDVLGLAMRVGQMGVWSRDLIKQRVWWSRELEELVGLPEGGFNGTEAGFFEFVHPDDRAMVGRAIDEALTSHADYSAAFRFRHASGAWRWMESRGRAVYGEDGRPVTLYGLGMDITAHKDAQEQLRRINEQLSQADRRKDEFLATLAHELRNPLAPMRNVVALLKLKDLADPQLQWSREVLERQLQHLTHLVDDLLEVSRITQGKLELRMQRVDLGSSMLGALEAATPAVKASSHTLDVDWPPEAIVLDADPTRLTQIILNLVNNAAKYTPPGGHIWLRAERQGKEAVITVRDSGIGIPAEHLSRIFEMFSQLTPALERSQGGLGIGLALVKGLVELHGGTVTAHSAGLDQGSTFTVRLPLPLGTDGQPEDRVPGAAALPSPASAGHRILVVDDNEDAAESLEMLLGLQGHEVEVARDGRQALLRAASFKPDVVLLDIGLPHLNGYEVARSIRQQEWGQAMRLIALTGWGQADDKQTAIAAGFDHHLTKPVDPGELETLLTALPRRAPRNQLA